MFIGGTFALYSLLCRHAKLSLLPNQQAADEELSTYYRNGSQGFISSPLKRFFENHKRLRTCLLLVVLFGACMVIGDGVITPAISGISGVILILKNNEFYELIFFSVQAMVIFGNNYAVLSSISGLQVRAKGLHDGMFWLLFRFVQYNIAICLLFLHFASSRGDGLLHYLFVHFFQRLLHYEQINFQSKLFLLGNLCITFLSIIPLNFLWNIMNLL